MVRTQLQLDEDTYEALRISAHKQRKSMSAVVRGILRQHIEAQEPNEQTAETDLKKIYSWIGSGKSGLTDMSINHDHYLEEAYLDIP